MKIIDIDLRENGKKYFCKQVNEVFEVEKGNLIPATRRFSMADLLKFDFEEIKETKNPYERVDRKDTYYVVNEQRGVGSFKDSNDYIDNKLFNGLNYFNNRNYAEYVALKENLMRRMDKFAWEHNAKAVKWDCNQPKYYIVFDHSCDEKLVVYNCFAVESNNVYFTSRKIAEKALKEFKDDLMKLYTWKFDF